jgi:starch phosphorylase
MTFMSALDPFIQRTHIAYLSMEIALRTEMHTYAGGLGVLAGDMARSSADLKLPIVFVSLISRAGYVRQDIDSHGRQVTQANPWQPKDWTDPLDAMVAVTIEGREVWIRPWLYRLTSPLGHCIPVLLLDTDIDQNRADDREITHHLYGGDEAYRLKQEIVLGIGGPRVLQAFGFKITIYHLNEGHAALLTAYLLRQFKRDPDSVSAGDSLYDHERVRERCVFTTHTPVKAGIDRFSYALVEQTLGDYIDLAELKRHSDEQCLNMTQLAFSLSGYVNGVSERHAQTTKKIFPGYHVRAITNGVHAPTWAHAEMARLFQAIIPQWAHEPEALEYADQIPDESIWRAHEEAKRALLAYVKETLHVALRLDVPLVGFARRMTDYKRPTLLFSDTERLLAIGRKRPLQVIFAGLAHPRDGDGQHLIEVIHQRIRELSPTIPIVFLPNYNMQIAARLVAGTDIWLNTPLPPLEASATSGMKAALNGVLNFSVLDGWWAEAHIEGVTGWSIGNGEVGLATHDKDAADLYRKLEDIVLPLYYDDRSRWIWMMKQSISKVGAYFNSTRMMRRYAAEAYVHAFQTGHASL